MSAITLRKYSPHLAGTLTRVFDGAAAEQIAPLFAWCIENGGLEELDFGREEGVSYNPRPARIALVLINDARSRDLVSVGAAVVAAGLEGAAFEPDGSPFQQRVAVRAELANRPLTELVGMPDDGAEMMEAAAIACSIWLDRVRHLHLALGCDASTWQWAIDENSRARALASRYSLPLLPLLDACAVRATIRRDRGN